MLQLSRRHGGGLLSRSGSAAASAASAASLRAWQRAQQHVQHVNASHRVLLYHTHAAPLAAAPVSGAAAAADTGADSVSIGSARVALPAATAWSRPDLVPFGHLAPTLRSDSQEQLAALSWMIQKYNLKQDIFLLGPPGPQKRALAFRFGEIVGREVEYVSISRDTTEADLKQRAEVVAGSLHYVDQPPVRCALFGRLLVLDGLEKAERNVLPTLNNLLENREMALDDGRFLMHHAAYDALRARGLTDQQMEERKLLRCSEHFRVIALGLPVPRFPGYSLDPPLRSRFQARAVLPLPLLSQLEVLTAKYSRAERELVANLLSARETLRLFESENALQSLAGASGTAPTKMPHWPASNIDRIVQVLDRLPVELQAAYADVHTLHAAFPFTLLCDALQSQTVLEAFDRFQLHRPQRQTHATTGRSTLLPLDLAAEPPKLFVRSVSRAQDTNDSVDADAQVLWDTPASLTSTPEQTLALIAAQKRLPTTMAATAEPVVQRVQPSSNVDEPKRHRLRLPRGRRLEVSLTTVCPDTGATAEGVDAAECRVVLEGSLERPGDAAAAAAAGSAVVPVTAALSTSASADSEPFVVTPFHRRLLAPLLLSLSSGGDVCLLGGRGLGKSATARWLGGLLGFEPRDIHVVHLFKDMSSRDLLQRRGTDSAGNTTWTSAPIVNAALSGGLAILDGLDRIPPATLQVLRRLIEDRELTLFDGTRLLRHDRYEIMLEKYTRAELDQLRIFPVLSSFRIIALAQPPPAPGAAGASVGAGRAAGGSAGAAPSWLLEETLPLFSFHTLGTSLDDTSRTQILRDLFPSMPRGEMDRVLRLVEQLGGARPAGSDAASAAVARSASSVAPASFHLSLRQCIQLLRHHTFYPNDLLPHVRRMLLHEFLPSTQRALLDQVIASSDFAADAEAAADLPTPSLESLLPRVVDGVLHIGSVSYPLNRRLLAPELVPHILFYNIPAHLLLLQDLLRDWIVDAATHGAGSSTGAHSHRRHLLLIGNQGVGKNKICDRLLELLQLEREYMQLHRDTTVQALTLSPSLKDGRVFYEDSALVRSVTLGRVLVIDEADKAPLEVVAVLKGLVQDGEMDLADGRKIVHALPKNISEREASRFIPIHPDFKLIVLANRPGHPFLGNDFFRDNGDVYSCHSVPNPDPNSEIALLRSYGPTVPLEQIRQLVDAFTELRALVLEGTCSYPYSTRELVAIVRHCEASPDDGLLQALDNVLDFDRFDPSAMRTLREVFARHGMPLLAKGAQIDVQVSLAEAEPLPQPRLVQTWSANAAPAAAATAKRTGLSSNATSAGGVAGGMASRFFSTAATAVSAVRGASSPASPAPSASLPSVVSSGPLSGRSWSLHLDGHVRANESFESRRLALFTEEKSTWKVPLNSSVSRPLGLSVLSDDSVHVLTSNYLTLTSYFPRVGGYHKLIGIELEEFFPMYEIAEDSLQMLSMPDLRTVAIFAPSHSMLLLLAFKQEAAGATGSASSASSAPHGFVLPKATASVIALQAPHSTTRNPSAAFLEYLTPGFKMPRWHSRAQNESKDSPKPFQLLDSLSSSGLLLFLQPGARFFMVLDLNADAAARQQREEQQQHGAQRGQVAANATLAVTKLPPNALGALTVVDVAAWLGAASIEKLVALSPSMWIIESSDQKRFVSTGAAGGWKWSAVSAGAQSSAATVPSDPASGSFVAHEHGWHYTPASNVAELVDQERHNPSGENITTDGQLRRDPLPSLPPLPHRPKPLDGFPMPHLLAKGDTAASATIPPAHAIFIPRQIVSGAAASAAASKGSQSANVLAAFQRNSSLLTPPPPSSLYRFAAGGLFEGNVASSATPSPSSDGSLYEIAYPELKASEQSTSAEAAYHSWLSTLLPSSSQLAMPAYFTYHMPPPSDSDSGVYVSKVEQPVLSLVDLFSRRIKHVPIRTHPSDVASASSRSAPISVDKFMHLGRNSRAGTSSFRSRQEETDERLDVAIDEQSMQDSLGSAAPAANATAPSSSFTWSRDRVLALRVLPLSGELVSLQANGRLRVWEVDPRRLAGAATNWRRLFGLSSQLGGAGQKPLRLELDSQRKRDAAAPKEGKIDKDNKPHVGGNQWKGGTGGADTAGLGGKGGPYRFDAGHDVHQMSVEEKAKVSAEVAQAARELGRKELAKRLGEIDLAVEDHALYSQYQSKVSKQIVQLRLILEQAEARHVEREWLRNQREGDLDDSKIVDAMTGERMVYRRRGLPVAQMGVPQRLPKRLHFVMDVSGSMYRFNGSDQRLERLLEATLLIMEALDGFDTKYSYSICGHSGDAASVPFVPYGGAPKSRKDRLKVLQRMYAHSQYCSSGDHTLEAVRAGIDEVAAVEADDYLTIVVSDANLRRYGIQPSALGAELVREPRVQAFVIFIASLEDEVGRIMPAMPPGRAFFCAETAMLPNLFRTILTASDIIAV